MAPWPSGRACSLFIFSSYPDSFQYHKISHRHTYKSSRPSDPASSTLPQTSGLWPLPIQSSHLQSRAHICRRRKSRRKSPAQAMELGLTSFGRRMTGSWILQALMELEDASSEKVFLLGLNTFCSMWQGKTRRQPTWAL